MRWFRFAVLICLATLLQAGLIDAIAVTALKIKPDLLLILVVFFAVYCSTSEAVITSFAIGFAADIIAIGSPMGPRMISFGLFGTLLAYLHRVVTIRKVSYQSMAIFAVCLLSGMLVYFLTFLASRTTTTPDPFIALFGRSLYSSLVGPFLFLPSAWWMRIKTHQFGKD